MKEVPDEARRVLRTADMMRKGALPVAGGLLDQPAGLMEAVRCVWGLEEPFRLKAGLSD
jgi:hypothetical protein